MPSSAGTQMLESSDDMHLARLASRQLASYCDRALTLRIDETKDQVELPAAAVKCLVELLSTLSRGDAVTIESTSAELSIQQAAQFLDASRQFLEQLVEQGDIPCQRRGSRHVLLIRDLIRYKRDVDEKRSGALDELAEQAQNLDLGY